MTTLIVDIENADDLTAVKNLFAERGLFYEEDENSYEDFVLTDEIKRDLDEDEEAFQKGDIKPVSAEESEARITEMLSRTKV